MLIASPFIKIPEARWICKSLRGKPVRLQVLTNVRSDSVLNGSLDIAALKLFSGATSDSKIFAVPRLHAKVYVRDADLAIITSSNLTPSGLDSNYCTDAVLFSEGDLIPERKDGTTWLRGIKVAFEHEHIYNKRLYEEISHLLIIHSDLSVLVSYPDSVVLKNLNHLRYFYELIKSSPRAGEFDADEKFLLIFGCRHPSLKWKGLIYKNAGWEEIEAPN